MQKKQKYLFNSQKFFKEYPLLSTVITGIFVSALWENILSPLSVKWFALIQKFLNQINENFTDNFYLQVSYGLHERASGLAFTFSMILFLTFCHIMTIMVLLLKKAREKSKQNDNLDEKQTQKKLKRNIFYSTKILIALALIATLSNFYMVGENLAITSTATITLNNIEIVAPYISDMEYKTIKSQFYSMQSENDYITITTRLEEIAEENNIRLKSA